MRAFKDAYEAIAFRAPWTMDLQGIVAQRRASRYHSGRSGTGSMTHPAIARAMLIALSKRVAAHWK